MHLDVIKCVTGSKVILMESVNVSERLLEMLAMNGPYILALIAVASLPIQLGENLQKL